MIANQITPVGGSGYPPEDASIYLTHLDGQAAIVDADILCEGYFDIYHDKRTVRKFIRAFMTVS